MKITFIFLLRLLLSFYSAIMQHITEVTGASASNGALISLNGTVLYIRTGYAAEKTLDAEFSSGSLDITFE